jgi:hypothetical protein
LPKHTKKGKNIQNKEKIYQMVAKCGKWPLNIPNDNKICQHLPLQEPPNIDQKLDF